MIELFRFSSENAVTLHSSRKSFLSSLAVFSASQSQTIRKYEFSVHFGKKLSVSFGDYDTMLPVPSALGLEKTLDSHISEKIYFFTLQSF